MEATSQPGGPRGLPKNAQRVHAALRAAARPMTAYELLDALRGEGITAPLTVYRALRRLTADGFVHRLESLNAYIVCAHPEDDAGEGGHAPAFIVCEDCGAVDEIEDDKVVDMLASDARSKGYRVSRMALELIGACRTCREDTG